MLRRAYEVLCVVTFLALATLFWFVFFRAPTAQLQAGGLAQKIFYFHLPAAIGMYVAGATCFVAGALYLLKPSDERDAFAKAGAECAVVFGVIALQGGSLWARKAWGVYWTWDPRLTTTLLSLLIYVSIVVLRAFGGRGDAERRFAAALGVLGSANLPIIHYSVRKWGGNHPTVVMKGGGGLQHPDMKLALTLGFVALGLLLLVLLWSRARLALAVSRLARCEEEALARGLIDG